tara:strand:- start:224 stop:685 length:462 start_codon:yes stop_codon:yes gene_type:complete
MTVKEKLLKNLKNDIYCRLGVSNIQGVGVFAIKDIPKGINPFKKPFLDANSVVDLSDEDVDSLDSNIKQYIKSFFAKDELGSYPVISNGMNSLDVTFYINHSSDPNVTIDDTKESWDAFSPFMALRNIESGEELTLDYKDLYRNDESQFANLK